MSVTMFPSGGYSSPSWDPGSFWRSFEKQFVGIPPESSDTSATSFVGGINQDNWLDYLIERANKGDTASIEKLINYYATKDSERTAREWTAQREDSAYQRLMEDMRKAGISPYILSGASPMGSASAGKSYSGSEMTSEANNRNTVQANLDKQGLSSFMSIIGIIIGAAMWALL